MPLFYVNFGSYKTIAIVEMDRASKTIIEMKLEDRLRSRLEVSCLDRNHEVKVTVDQCSNNGFTKATMPDDWRLPELVAKLDAMIDTLSISCSLRHKGLIEAQVEIQTEWRELLCEWPEGSGNRVFLSDEDRTRIIREGNSTRDYWIIPEHDGGEERVTTRTERHTVMQWEKAQPREPVVISPINWDDDDLLF